jgi:hypothetical protein
MVYGRMLSQFKNKVLYKTKMIVVSVLHESKSSDRPLWFSFIIWENFFFFPTIVYLNFLTKELGIRMAHSNLVFRNDILFV